MTRVNHGPRADNRKCGPHRGQQTPGDCAMQSQEIGWHYKFGSSRTYCDVYK
jgi:hypothetical protein